MSYWSDAKLNAVKGFCLCAFAAGLLLAACNKNEEIKVYRVAKAPLEESTSSMEDAMPTNAATPPFAGAAVAPPSAALAPAPPGWEPQPLSQMRQASFLVHGDGGAVTDISLVSLGTSAGNVLDNVNRWLDQIGQPPVTPDKLGQIVQHLTTSAGDVTVVDLQGLPKGADAAKDGRIVAAMITANGSTLFFKMRGNAALSEAQKPEFLKWVASVCNGQDHGKPDEMSAMNGGGAPEPAAAGPQIKFKTPAGWAEVPPSAMRYASFTAAASGGKLDISVVTFPGDGGSDADNVNRWRRQIGLGPVDDKAVAGIVAPLNVGATDYATLDMTGGDTRVLAAWTRRDGRSWFFKMSGPGAAVEEEKAKFFDWVKSVEFHS